MMDEREEELIRSVALRNAQSILAARQTAEQALLEAQNELRESRELLRAALGAAGAGVFRWQPDRDQFILGDNLVQMLGRAPGQSRLDLHEMVMLFHPTDRERLAQQLGLAAKEGLPVTQEFRLLGEGRQQRWLELRGRFVEGNDSVERSLLGTMTDITQRKEHESALQAGNELLRTTFEQAAVGIAIAGMDGTFEQVNDKFVQILGYDRAQLGRMTFSQITHPLDLDRTRELVASLVAGEIENYALEKRYVRADGSIVWSHTTVTMLRDPGGKGERFVGAINDITDRKAAEQALLDETRVLEALNATNAVLASQLDLEVLLRQVTDAATALSGAQFGAFFYNGVDEQGEALMLYTLSGAPRSAFDNLGHPRPTSVFGPTFRGEGIVRSDDILADPRYGQFAPHHGMPPGHLLVRSYLAVPVRSRSGEVIGGLFFGHPEVGIFTDRSERIVAGIAAQAAIAVDNARMYEDVVKAASERERLLEAERSARAQAERAGIMKDEFLSTLSHELRTPLNAVLGWAQILLTRPADADLQRRGAETICRNAKAQAKLIDDLLDMNRIVSGKVRIDVQPTWLEGVLDAAMESVRPSAEAKEISLVKVADAAAGPVAGDPNRLQQVIWNLLSNAIKFTPRKGRVQVHLARVDSQVELRVSDNGSGIDPEFLPHVFERFRQADSSTTRSVGGLGLGLAIVKQLVEVHGGHVHAYSEGAGKGAAFCVKLPIAPMVGGLERVGTARGSAASPVEPVVDLKGLDVLVVDDEADARAIVAYSLEQSGAMVHTASGVDEALELLGRQRVDLVVSDIGMPHKDGYQLIRAMRQLPEPLRGIPAVALTAFARSEDRTRALLAGYQVHLSKPIDPRELVATAGSLLGRFSAGG